jgi:transposase InsO family protein
MNLAHQPIKHTYNSFQNLVYNGAWPWGHYIKALTENQTEKILKVVRYDRGGEFSSRDFKEFFDKHGIKREYTIPRTPHQNGVVERQNRSVQQIARSMMNERNISQTYWVEAIHIVVDS